jgi:soluble lytic murein transglycosylase
MDRLGAMVGRLKRCIETSAAVWLAAVGLLPLAVAPAAWAADLPPISVSQAERSRFTDAYSAFRAGDLARARRTLAPGDSLSGTVIDWLHLSGRNASASFGDFAAFIDANPAWPRLNAVRRNAEVAVESSPESADDVVIAWFDRNPPLSAAGKARLGEAKLRAGQRDEAIRLLREAWIEGDLSDKRERDLGRRHRQLLSQEDHRHRLVRLLWDRERAAASRMLSYVDEPTRAFGRAWLALMGAGGNPDSLLAKVPEEYREHPGLAIERARWRRQKGDDGRARALLLGHIDEMRPEVWWQERRIHVRRALTAGHVSEAYAIASGHDLSEGAEYAEAEWLSGWIALRFLNDPRQAGFHFAKMYGAVQFPVSSARAAYWSGRAAEARNDQAGARTWYEEAARHGLTYYGQLAVQNLGRAAHYALPKDPVPTAEERRQFGDNDLVRAAFLLGSAGGQKTIDSLIQKLAIEPDRPGQVTLALALAERFGRRDLAVAAGKKAAQEGVHVVTHAYPLMEMPREFVTDLALVLAVARQESQFNPEAVSPAGARGLMQLMPATAQRTAKSISLPYSEARLTEDSRYNTVLGSAHLAELLKSFNGSYVLSIAAYNAGEGRVRKWIKDNGDPRWAEVDEVDWVEQIPFEETRNYVQRVMEGIQIYRERLLGRPVPLRLSQDLKR